MAPSLLKGKISLALLVMIVIACLAIGFAVVVTLAARGAISITLPAEPARLQDLVWRIANFSVLIIILHVALTGRAVTFFTGRKKAIQEALDEAVKARQEAQKKYEEVDKMLKKAKEEIEEIHFSFTTEGQRERDRIIKNAEREADKIKKQAESTAVQEVKKARFALRAEAVDIAVSMAEGLLTKNINKDDQKKITRDFIEKTSEAK
ncbi:MAG: ATP synthase F0 subunit B [Deltaproteobacteria bacterium]|nr:ATP synthase F0 subunit B [Candidatus Zymogenaceae bacterium]